MTKLTYDTQTHNHNERNDIQSFGSSHPYHRALVFGATHALVLLCAPVAGCVVVSDLEPMETCAPNQTSVEILFPPPSSTTSENTVVVRGTANNTDGLLGLTINGTPAISEDGFDNWWANVDLAPGDNTLSVDVEHCRGRALASVDPVQVTRVFGEQPTRGQGAPLSNPLAGILDPEHRRALILESPDDEYSLVDIDLETGDRSIIVSSDVGDGPPLSNPQAFAFDASGGRLYLADWASNALFTVDVATGDRTIISDAETGTGPAIQLPHKVFLNLPRNQAIVALYEYEGERDALLAIDLTTGDRTLLASYLQSPLPVGIDARHDRLIFWSDELFAVDLVSGELGWLTDITFEDITGVFSPVSMTITPNGLQILVTDLFWGDVATIDLNTGVFRVLPSRSPGFELPGVIMIDEHHPWAFIVDYHLGALFAYDLNTGARVYVSR